jgi:hypothetical protein
MTVSPPTTSPKIGNSADVAIFIGIDLN